MYERDHVLPVPAELCFTVYQYEIVDLGIIS